MPGTAPPPPHAPPGRPPLAASAACRAASASRFRDPLLLTRPSNLLPHYSPRPQLRYQRSAELARQTNPRPVGIHALPITLALLKLAVVLFPIVEGTRPSRATGPPTSHRRSWSRRARCRFLSLDGNLPDRRLPGQQPRPRIPQRTRGARGAALGSTGRAASTSRSLTFHSFHVVNLPLAQHVVPRLTTAHRTTRQPYVRGAFICLRCGFFCRSLRAWLWRTRGPAGCTRRETTTMGSSVTEPRRRRPAQPM